MRLDWRNISPDGMKAMLDLQHVVDKSSLDHKLLELVKIRASQINGCAYCLDMHTKDAIALGENPQRLHVVSAWREAPFYSPRERAALAWCETLTQISEKGAPDSVYSEVESIFSPQEIVELTLAIVVINSWNRLAVGFHNPVGDYVSNIKRSE